MNRKLARSGNFGGLSTRPIPFLDLSIFLFILFMLAACGGGTQLPKGPPPEYEDEPGMTQPQGDASPQPSDMVDAGTGG